MLVIGSDIGGTHARWELARKEEGRISVLHAAEYPTRSFDSVTSLLQHFASEAKTPLKSIDAACLAIPGPVNNNQGSLTNVGWQVDGNAISTQLDGLPVQLVNDLQAAAQGTLAVEPENRILINEIADDPHFPRLVIGVGTGLGSAWLIHEDGNVRSFASEAGHADFAPADDEQRELVQFMDGVYPQLSWEHLLGGYGLPFLYGFYGGTAEPGLNAARVNKRAQDGDEKALSAVHLFTRLLGAYAGNMALAFQPRDGIYIVGGAASRMARWISPNLFMEAFVNKDRMSTLLGEFPVYLVTDDRVGIKGAVRTAINR